MNKKLFFCFPIAYILLAYTLTACGTTAKPTGTSSAANISSEETYSSQSTPSNEQPLFDNTKEKPSNSTAEPEITTFPPTDSPLEPAPATLSPTPTIVYRDNTPVCLVPVADGSAETHNEVASIDYSHSSDGYVMANYTGSCPKVKLRITSPDTTVYTYDLHQNGYEAFPLSSGSGTYEITIYENISGTNYSTCLYEKISVSLTDEFSPFLYPNQYVNFNENSQTVAKGAELAATAVDELDVITNIYDYITTSITYDYEKASNPPTGYTTNVDEILNSETGICLDYAAVMASMLRSQRIPTRLEVGYAQDAYHAWISVYTEESGWLSGIIKFDGNTWSLVDPTFGANTDDETLKKFIGDGTNYILQKMY